ncbi:ABC transporter permease [Nocardioides aurantiacus]|uniref:ABC-2 type transport system permease protein n=1 Tax=Nocardioides aurantiacus TaxID=86796 RepID=A0A3N2CPE6_9ACTN|nr:multidrug ABC transporter permease [Nocardioides aurantiacus]ROR89407.1 ABC-2 type transport system permease protein [Nocardioides aurantiacus]
MSTRLAGVGPLLRVSLRQDALRTVPWVLLVCLLPVSSVVAYDLVFPAARDRAALAASMGSNPALSLLLGPARDLSTADGFAGWRSGQVGAVFAGLMTVLVVVRHSRAQEDSGQAELLASAVMARGSRLAVALLVAGLAAGATGVTCAVATVSAGGDPRSSWLLAATFTASGLVFAGVAAVTAQLASDARTATGLAVAVLGLSYVLRGYLDAAGAPAWTTWLTPLGWLEATRPGAGDRPAPLLLALVASVALAAAAFVLQSRRDFGQGLLAARTGPAEAGSVGSPWGLAVRLQRGPVLAWVLAVVGTGLLLGSLTGSVGDLVAENPTMAALLASGALSAGGLAFAFVVTMLQVLALLAAVAGVQVVVRAHAEEAAHRLEQLLAAGLRRRTHLATHAVIALGAPSLALLLAGAALGVVAHGQEPDVATGDVVLQAAATLPAVWLLVGLALAAVGAAPRLRAVGWLAVVGTFVLTVLGPTLDLPGWALDLSPLRHVPDVAAPGLAWGGSAALAAVAAGLVAVAFVGLERRDVG